MNNYKYQPLNSSSEVDYSSYFTFSGDKKRPYKLKFDTGSSSQSCFDWVCTSIVIFLVHVLFVVTLPFSALCTLKLVRQYERFIVYRLGRLRPVKGPGVVLVLPCIDRIQKIDLRTKAFNVPPSKLCTTDGCIISIGAMIQFRIEDPLLMSLSVQNVDHALRDSALSDMTNMLSKKSFNDIKSRRLSLGYDLQTDINQSCREWGVEVSRVELSDVTLLMAPQSKPSSFMPMHGAEPPPQMAPPGGDGLNTFAQLAQQFFAHAVNASNSVQPEAPVDISGIIDRVAKILSPELVQEVSTSYEFFVDGIGTYYLDLTHPPGSVGRGGLSTGRPDVKIKLSQETCQNLFAKTLSPTSAYASSKLNIEGSIASAKKLDKVFQRL